MVEAIKRILENAGDFYNDFKHELRQADDDTGDKTVHLALLWMCINVQNTFPTGVKYT